MVSSAALVLIVNVVCSAIVMNAANLAEPVDNIVNINVNDGWTKSKQQLAEDFIMGDKSTHLMWFLQVCERNSIIHIILN